VLVIGGAFAVNEAESIWSNSRAKIAVPLVILTGLLVTQVPLYWKSGEEWSRLKYGEIFVTANRLANVVNRLLEPNETFFQMGDETQLYPITGRRAPSGILATSGLCEPGPFTKLLRQRMVDDLSASKPDLLIFHMEGGALVWDRGVTDFVDQYYRLAPYGRLRSYFLWVRKGSALEARMQKMAEAEQAHTANSSESK
jgi:hypothetical protein